MGELDLDRFSSMHVAKRFDHNTLPIHCIDVSQSGDVMVTSSQDDSIHIYAAGSGTLRHRLMSKKYGAGLVRLTLDDPEYAIISSMNGWDHNLRLLSLEKNTYSLYLKGHRANVTSVSFSALYHQVLVSASEDRTARLWDLRIPFCQGCVQHGLPTEAAFDPMGVVVACGTNSGQLELYDVRVFDGGPFLIWKRPRGLGTGDPWAAVAFSDDGQLLLAAQDTALYLIDAFTGQLLSTFQRPNRRKLRIAAAFGDASNVVLSGDDRGWLHAWDTHSGLKLCEWDPQETGAGLGDDFGDDLSDLGRCRQGPEAAAAHNTAEAIASAEVQPITCLVWHPKLDLLGTGSSQLALWTCEEGAAG